MSEPKYRTLRARGSAGSVSDMFASLVREQTGRSDASERDYWNSLVPSPGALNDVKYNALGVMGYNVNSLPDREYAYWADYGLDSLFTNGQQGVWYDPSDFSTLFQDAGGTTPVTAVGQPVGKINDKSVNGNHATQATAGKRPILQQDGGGKYYLNFDGIDDSMVTSSINFSASDKMTIWAGVHIPNSSAGIISELGVGAQFGSFYLVANESADRDSFISTGTVDQDPAVAPVLAAPRTRVLTGIGDISSDTKILRANGVQAASNTADQGLGNYGNYPLYIGGRIGLSIFFNGRMYGLLVRGGASSASEIALSETYIAVKSGVAL